MRRPSQWRAPPSSLLRGALRRIAALVAIVVSLTAVVSLVIGALAGAHLLRSLAVGFFVVGVRGPLRPEWDQGKEGAISPTRGFFPTSVRRATPDERSDSKRNSFGLFLFGLALVCIGAGFDPTRHFF